MNDDPTIERIPAGGGTEVTRGRGGKFKSLRPSAPVSSSSVSSPLREDEPQQKRSRLEHDKAYKRLTRLAYGKKTTDTVRRQALADLLAYQHGKPRQQRDAPFLPTFELVGFTSETHRSIEDVLRGKDDKTETDPFLRDEIALD